MSKIKAIIFDLDGVIIDSEYLWSQADLLFLKSEGIKIEKNEYEKITKPILMGSAFSEGVELFKKLFGLKGGTEKLLSKRKLFVQEALKNVQQYGEFNKFHKAVKRKYKTAVATALVRYFLDPISLKFKLLETFDGHVYSIEDIGFISKPNPDIYLHAAKKLGLKPSQCIGIEDSPKGVEAVNAAGMTSVAITTTTKRDLLSHANLIVDSFSEINLADL